MTNKPATTRTLARRTLTDSGQFVDRPTYRPIPRDRQCWYCAAGQHARCPWPETCACWSCYASAMISPCPLVVRALAQDGAR